MNRLDVYDVKVDTGGTNAFLTPPGTLAVRRLQGGRRLRACVCGEWQECKLIAFVPEGQWMKFLKANWPERGDA